MTRQRLDIMLFEQGLTDSREKARALILAGKVTVNGQMVDKPGTKIDLSAQLAVAAAESAYVSRGGIKMAGAAEKLGFQFAGKSVLDIGASTGGFTDYALQHGALRAVAVDVGYGQLDWKLRADPRVAVMERTNIRHVTPDQMPVIADIAVIDVSFISLVLVLPVVRQLIGPEAEVVALVKPQFEAGREQVGKRGVVKDPAIHTEVLRKIIDFAETIGFFPQAACYSPITGPNGNIEFFLYLAKTGPSRLKSDSAEDIVAEAHQNLRGTP